MAQPDHTRNKPRGWIRPRLLPFVSRWSAVLAGAVLLVWLGGRIWTDTTMLSQAAWFLPSEVALLASAVLLGFSRLVYIPATRPGGILVRPVVLLGWLGTLGWFVWVECRPAGVLDAGAGDVPSARVLHWNLSFTRELDNAGEAVLELAPDVAIVAHPRRDQGFDSLVDGIARLLEAEPFEVVDTTPEADPDADSDAGQADQPADDATAPTGPGLLEGLEIVGETRVRVTHWMVVASRWPIVRTGEAPLRDVGDSALEESGIGWRSSGDYGRVAFLELDTGDELGLARPMVVWVVDLPSDPTLHREATAREARRVVDAWRGPAFAPDDMGRWIGRMSPEAVGFPLPDVVVGDFNAPRGSRSLRHLVDGLREAHAEAGFGPDRTWNFKHGIALWSIDHAYASDDWRIAHYDITPPPRGPHALQVIEVVPAE